MRSRTLFFFKQKTAYEIGTGDWSSDVCSSDLELEERLRPLQSCLVNTVHDSAVVDVHPNEKEYVLQIINDLNKDLDNIIQEAYDIELCVPMLLEAKIGNNWLDTVDVI